jgi:hypothetical protein
MLLSRESWRLEASLLVLAARDATFSSDPPILIFENDAYQI